MGYKTHRRDLRGGGVLGPSEVRPHYAAPLELELSIHPRGSSLFLLWDYKSYPFPFSTFSHLSGSLGLRRATSLSFSSLFSKDDDGAEDLPSPGILAIPLSRRELLRL